MGRGLKAAKKPYIAPAFQVRDAGAAKVELETIGASQDANVRQMLLLINRQLEGKTARVQPAWQTPVPKDDSH